MEKCKLNINQICTNGFYSLQVFLLSDCESNDLQSLLTNAQHNKIDKIGRQQLVEEQF